MCSAEPTLTRPNLEAIRQPGRLDGICRYHANGRSAHVPLLCNDDRYVRWIPGKPRAGAAYPAVVASDFERAEIMVPSKGLLDAFNELTEPIFFQIHNLMVQNQKLRAARDLLLPRLMNGEIAV